jgi:hypothetical protein
LSVSPSSSAKTTRSSPHSRPRPTNFRPTSMSKKHWRSCRTLLPNSAATLFRQWHGGVALAPCYRSSENVAS